MTTEVETPLSTPEMSLNDYADLKETVGLIVHEYMKLNVKHYMQPKFHKTALGDITEMLGYILDSISKEYDVTAELLQSLIKDSMNVFYTYIAPRRSSGTTFIRIKQSEKQKKTMKEKIDYLQSIPQPDQRTSEWYEFRYKHLTASNIWKTFLTESTRNQLIFEKCQPLNLDKYSGPSAASLESPLHWGQKYEPLSVMLYEKVYETSVSDFGCLPHPTLEFLAASPDGINTLEASDRYGRMLEIKNIYNREITGIPKLEYWVQMQLQMEVCNLNECDFLETRFKEYTSKEEFETDATTEHKGLIMLFMNDKGQPVYEYGPLDLSASPTSIENWQESIMDKHATANWMWMKNIYWKLDELSCVLVLRNKLWFSSAVPQLKELWKTIEEEKENGSYVNRAPKKMNPATRTKKKYTTDASSDIYITSQSMCLIEHNEEVVGVEEEVVGVEEVSVEEKSNK